jgi:hypothetical protein
LTQLILEFCLAKSDSQMQDTAAVLGQLDLSQTKKLLAITNTRGAQIASSMLKSNT